MEQNDQVCSLQIRSNIEGYQIVWGYRNVQYGFPHSAYYLFSILEIYNPKFGTVFTPMGELGLALHKIFEASLLSMGELSYKEIILRTHELQWIKKYDPHMYKIYLEVMCHYCIC